MMCLLRQSIDTDWIFRSGGIKIFENESFSFFLVIGGGDDRGFRTFLLRQATKDLCFSLCFFFFGGNNWGFRNFSWNNWCLSLLSKSTEDLSFCFSFLLLCGNNRSFWNFSWNNWRFFILSKSTKNVSSGYSFLLLSCDNWNLCVFSWNYWCFSMFFRMMFVMMMFLLRQTLDASWFFRFSDVKIL
jgi:hypothetical protein